MIESRSVECDWTGESGSGEGGWGCRKWESERETKAAKMSVS